jgi:hypothetical protein
MPAGFGSFSESLNRHISTSADDTLKPLVPFANHCNELKDLSVSALTEIIPQTN